MQYEWLDEYLLSLPGAEKDYKPKWGWFRYMIRGKLHIPRFRLRRKLSHFAAAPFPTRPTSLGSRGSPFGLIESEMKEATFPLAAQ